MITRPSLRAATIMSGIVFLVARPGIAGGQAQVEPPEANLPQTSATIVPGTPPQTPQALPRSPILPGDISLNFPSADINIVAKAVLGDILHVPYTVSPEARGPVTVVTARPIARQSVIAFLEEAIGRRGFAIIALNGGFEIQSINTARATAPINASPVGFANEVITLKFVGAAQIKALLDPVLPGLVSSIDADTNTVTLSGTAGQRASARDLLGQFDVNWLRAMSFGLYVPKTTDSRLIVPELEKLINAPDSPTKGLVRLLTMEKLNAILAVSRQPQYLDDVARWIEILDREGRSNEARLFVYNVQNSRSRDLARTINAAFGNAAFSNAAAEPGTSNFGGSADGIRLGRQTGGPAQDDGVSRQGQDNISVTPATSDSAASSQGSGERAGHSGAIITSDDSNNAVIVFGTPREYALVEEALRKLDVLPVQVMIEAAITEVSLNDDLRYGVQWNFTSGNTSTVLTDSTTSTDLVRAVPGFSFLFANTSLSAVLSTLESKTKVNVVSAPKLLVLNNQTAALQVGDQVPVLTTSSTSTISANAPVINAVEYRDTGVILKVTPRVNATGLVLLDITQEVSDVNTTRSTGGVNSPTISTRRITTSVAVNDGEVLALGGLIRNTQSRDKIGLPVLSQLPVIGGLFGRHANLESKIELIVLLRPRVVRTIDDGRAITDELRRKIRSLEPFKTSGTIP
ncbi:MAG: type II secretion system secretin GspD [Sphingomonas sp.]|jgi:general secretion pathway protein D